MFSVRNIQLDGPMRAHRNQILKKARMNDEECNMYFICEEPF